MSYENVIETISELRKRGANISLSFTVTSWATLDDASHALEIARRYNASLLVGIYDKVTAFRMDSVGRVNLTEDLMRIFS